MKKLTRPVLIIGTANSFPEIEYATGFRAIDCVVFVQAGCEKYLIVSRLESDKARRMGRNIHVFTPETLGLNKTRRRNIGEWAVRLLKRLKIKRVTVSPFFPHGAANRLARAGIHVIVIQTNLFPERAVKNKDELRKIKETQQAAVIAIRAAVAMISSSEIDNKGYLRSRGEKLTSDSIKRVITKILIEHNCFCRDIIVAGGAQAVNPHDTGSGPLRAHEAIVIDIFPQHIEHGYWGDLTRTVVKGEPPLILRKMYYAVKAAQSAAFNRIKAGVKCATVHQGAVDEFERRGFDTTIIDGKRMGFIHNTGHGVGLAIHEAPSISPADERLKMGNVITVEPGLYYPGKGGIRIEDTIIVTRRGWHYLVPCEKRFEI